MKNKQIRIGKINLKSVLHLFQNTTIQKMFNSFNKKEREKMDTNNFSKIRPAVLFIRGNENSRKSQLESLKSYCDTHNLDIIKTFECDGKNLNYRTTFNEMVKYVKSNHTKIAVVTYDVSKLQVGFEQSVCLNDLRNKKGSEIHFYKEDLIINRNSLAMDIARWDFAILANKMYVGLLKDNIRKSLSSKKS